jgi:hypothetical protein
MLIMAAYFGVADAAVKVACTAPADRCETPGFSS